MMEVYIDKVGAFPLSIEWIKYLKKFGNKMEEKELTPKELSYKPKKNNSYFIANAIIEAICYKNKINKELNISEFSNMDFYAELEESTEIEQIFNKSKNILKESTRVIRVFDLFEYRRPNYKLSTDKWFQDSKFSINDNLVLKELSSLILYYVGNNQDASYMTFFEKMDRLIEYVIKPSIEHNNDFEIENHIIYCINGQKDITIIDDENNEINVIANKIKFKKISSNKVEKILVYELYDNDSTLKETSLNKVVINKNPQNSLSNSNILSMPTTNLSINLDSGNIQEEELLEVILECDSVIYEYLIFLKNMKIFDTEEKLKEYQINYEIKPQDNKFYIVATDRKEMIISTVLHTLPHARIINNNELNDEIISRFKKYVKGIGFKICEDKTPPTPPSSNDPSKSTSNKPSLKNSSKKSIIPKDIAEKINKIGGVSL